MPHHPAALPCLTPSVPHLPQNKNQDHTVVIPPWLSDSQPHPPSPLSQTSYPAFHHKIFAHSPLGQVQLHSQISSTTCPRNSYWSLKLCDLFSPPSELFISVASVIRMESLGTGLTFACPARRNIGNKHLLLIHAVDSAVTGPYLPGASKLVGEARKILIYTH